MEPGILAMNPLGNRDHTHSRVLVTGGAGFIGSNLVRTPVQHDSLLDASNFVASIEKRQGQKIACLEEVAYRSGFLSAEQLLQASTQFPNAYGDYLKLLGRSL